MSAWDECPHDIDMEAMKGRECFGGLDLASVNDLVALTLLFPEPDGSAIVLPIFWLPGDNIDALAKQHKVSYRVWTDTGALRTTDGNVIDYDAIVAQIVELAGIYRIKQIGIDRLFQGQAVETRLMNAGLDVVPIGQGWRSQSLPAKELERMVLSRRLNHGGHPILRWNAGNVVAVRDSADNISISKSKSRSKIDGVAALLMSLLCKLNDSTGATGNFYEQNEVIVLDM
jgi:phage terminase large subunit-like protein